MIEIENITSHCYKVLVRCYTYNHGQYIQDALNGFAMQQTNFSFVCLVMDDYSTDGEQEVIKAYLDRECDMTRAEFFEDDTTTMTLVPHRTNVNCTFAVYFLKKNLYGIKGAKKVYVNPWREHCEYEALCEGDDYWIDPLKLQKQVDFLENHEEFGLCCSKSKIYNQEKRCFVGEKGDASCESYAHILLQYNDLNTASTLVKKNLWHNCGSDLSSFLPESLIFDTAYWYWFACNSKIKYFDEPFSVYRVLPESACHSKDPQKLISFELRFLQLKLLFMAKYPVEPTEERIRIAEDVYSSIKELSKYSQFVGETQTQKSKAYRIGKTLLKPLKWIKRHK